MEFSNIIHAPEMHYSPETQEKCVITIDALISKAKELQDVLVVFTGDFFDHAVQNTERSGLPVMISKIEELSEVACVVMIAGTRSSHDIKGCYKVFKDYATIYTDKEDIEEISFDNVNIFYLPELLPTEFIGNNTDSLYIAGRDEVNSIKNRISVLKKETKSLNIILGHGTVLGKETLTNSVIEQTGKYNYKESEIAETGCDLALFGHLHFPYRFQTCPGGYIGSLANNYKDKGFIPHFDVYHDINYGITNPEHIYLPFKGRDTVKVNATKDVTEYGKVSLVKNVIIKPMVTISQNNNTSSKRKEIRDYLSSKYPNAIIDNIQIKQLVLDKTRSAEVVNMVHNRDMYKLYDPNATEKDLLAQDWLEEQLIKSGNAIQKKNIKLISVLLKNYKLIRKSLEAPLFINFEEFPTDLYAVIAKGGYGKSSLADIMIPHSECISKPISKKDALSGTDACIEQVYDVNGDKIVCKIAGNAETGNIFYSCSKNDVSLCDKNLKEYKTVINDIFGSLQQTVISCLASQRPVQNRTVDGVNPDPDIFNSDNRTMKELYNVFCGLDKSSTAKLCKEKAKEYSLTVDNLKNELIGVESVLTDIDCGEFTDTKELENELKQQKESLAVLLGKISKISDVSDKQKEIESKISAKESELDILQKKRNNILDRIEAIEWNIIDINSINDKIAAKKKLELDNQKLQKEYQDSIKLYGDNLEDYNSVKNQINEVENKITSLNKSIKTEVDSYNQKLQNKYQENFSLYSKNSDNYNNVKTQIGDIEYKISTLKYNLKCVIDKKEDYDSGIIHYNDLIKKAKGSVTCEKCGHVSSSIDETVRSYELCIQENKEGIIEETEKIHNLTLNITKEEQDLEQLKAKIIDKPEPPKEPKYKTFNTIELGTPLYEKIQKLSDNINKEELELNHLKAIIIDKPVYPQEPNFGKDTIIETVEQLEKTKTESLLAEEKIKGLKNEKENNKNQILPLQKEIESLNDELLKMKIDNSDTLVRESENLQREINENESKLKRIEKDNIIYDQRKKQTKSLEEKIITLNNKIFDNENLFNDWDKYTKAWSRNGIPARFIEMSAPNIDAVANELLAEFYPKFFVETILTETDSKGNVKDTFDIIAYNTESGESYSITGLSGEQGNFVKTALYASFRQELRKNSGIEYSFLFLDEQDSNVCLTQQQNFFNMVKKIQEDLGCSVFVASHSAEMPNCINNHINLEEI